MNVNFNAVRSNLDIFNDLVQAIILILESTTVV